MLPLLRSPQFIAWQGHSQHFGVPGAHPHQQRVVDQPIGKHQTVAIREGCHGSQVCLEATGKQQRPLTPQPGGEFGLQLQMHRPGASNQPRAAGPKATGGQFRSGGSQYGGMAAEAQVVVAG